jgi:hypothetical protein
MGGGGGGGGYGGGGGALSPAESLKIFKTGVEEVRSVEAGPPRTRNVFISFHVADEAQVNLLRAQAKDADFGMEFRDYSVKEPFDEAWKSNCRQQLSLTSMTICMIGPDTATREAVDWELEESFRQGHKVIGVRIYRDRNDPVPAPLLAHKSPITYWNRDGIRNHLDSE